MFWKPVTAHLLEICAHSNANLREWGTNALTTLIKSAIKQVLTENNNVSFCEGDLAVIFFFFVYKKNVFFFRRLNTLFWCR